MGSHLIAILFKINIKRLHNIYFKILKVRAGLASNSQPFLLDLLRETASLNSSMTVWSSEGDNIEVDRLRALILTVGLERTYLDVPHELAERLRLPPPDANTKN